MVIIKTCNNEKTVNKVGKVFAQAFRTEGVNQYIFDFTNDNILSSIEKNIVLDIKYHLETGSYQLIVAMEGEEVVGGALLKLHEQGNKRRKSKILTMVRKIYNGIPVLFSIRWRNVIRFMRLLKPDQNLEKNHYTLSALAVLPEYQGRGIGKRLLQEVNNRSEMAIVDGIYLYTADKRNKDLYEKLNYSTFEEKRGKGITVYHMYRKVAI